MPPQDFATLAMLQSFLGGSTSKEEPFLRNELARRLILSGLSINISGVISATIPIFSVSVLTGTPSRVAAFDGSGNGISTLVTNALVDPAAAIAASKLAAGSGIVTVLLSSVAVNQNDWSPGIVGNTVIEWSGASNITITGLSGGVVGQRVSIKNLSSKVISLPHHSGSSISANQFHNSITSGPTWVAPGGNISYTYDSSFWVLETHQQGAWITYAFNAGDFTASGGGTWIVGSQTILYRLDGNTLSVKFSATSSNITGSPGNLIWALPGGLTHIGNAAYMMTRISDAGSSPSTGMCIGSGTGLNFFSSLPGGGWTNTAGNNTSTEGNVTLAIT